MEKMEVLLETSARHIHVTQEALETLFGKGHELTKKKDCLLYTSLSLSLRFSPSWLPLSLPIPLPRWGVG